MHGISHLRFSFKDLSTLLGLPVTLEVVLMVRRIPLSLMHPLSYSPDNTIRRNFLPNSSPEKCGFLPGCLLKSMNISPSLLLVSQLDFRPSEDSMA